MISIPVPTWLRSLPSPFRAYDESPSPAPPPPLSDRTRRDLMAESLDTSQLPTLRAGVYRHFKGHYYQVLGYAEDADDTQTNHEVRPRVVVVYVALYVQPERLGPRLYVRSAADFFVQVCSYSGKPPAECSGHDCASSLVDRFTYLAPEWVGD